MSGPAREFVRALRPKQWTKNAVVFAAFVFALGDIHQQIALTEFWTVALAALAFCAASSSIYLLNDVRDQEADRRHPTKRHRPVASGTISPAAALGLSAVLVSAALAGGALLSVPLAQVIAGYVVLQVLYSMFLKRVAMIDVLVIASGFVLRAIAGAVVIGVLISPWLLVCTFFLALFLGLCKRRQEFIGIEPGPGESNRSSLEAYTERLLDQLIGISAASTLVGYGIYTLSPDTLEKFNTTGLAFTLPFVVFGLFRYLHLVYRRDLGERPEQVLLTDLPLLINIGLYGGAVMAVLYL